MCAKSGILCSCKFQIATSYGCLIVPCCSSYIRSDDNFVLEKIQEILEKLPARIELPPPNSTAQHQHLSSATSSHQSHVQLSPYWVLLSREVSQLNHKLSVVSGSLSFLRAAVNGSKTMLEDDETVYQALVTDTVPKSWQVCTSRIFCAWLWANPIHHEILCLPSCSLAHTLAVMSPLPSGLSTSPIATNL